MKVTNEVGAISGLAESRAVAGAGEREAASSARSQGSSASSSLELSARVGDVDEIVRAARATDELRSEFVEQAKVDMAAGSLTADSMDLARLIASDLF